MLLLVAVLLLVFVALLNAVAVFSITGVCGESSGRMPTNEDSSQHFLIKLRWGRNESKGEQSY